MMLENVFCYFSSKLIKLFSQSLNHEVCIAVYSKLFMIWVTEQSHHEPASILPDSDDVSGLGRQSEIKFSINNVYAAFTALEGPTCTALIKMTG